jgi:hypothetical protein
VAERWCCPRCDREFARANQSHTCVPGISLAQYLDGRTPHQRDVFEALLGSVRSLGPVHVDAVGVGVFLRRQSRLTTERLVPRGGSRPMQSRKLAELRPRRDGVTIYLVLPGRIDDERCTRSERISAARIGNIIPVTGPDQVDEQLQAWLRQAYQAAAE